VQLQPPPLEEELLEEELLEDEELDEELLELLEDDALELDELLLEAVPQMPLMTQLQSCGGTPKPSQTVPLHVPPCEPQIAASQPVQLPVKGLNEPPVSQQPAGMTGPPPPLEDELLLELLEDEEEEALGRQMLFGHTPGPQ
jgi:hypothetical protein